MARKLFGTDGVRGVAGEELTAELALALGRSRAQAQSDRPRVLVIRDTRESGEMLESAARRRAQRGRCRNAARRGAADTRRPAADRPLRLRPGGGDLGLPQPLPDNGIKFFGADGYKLTDEQELEIERDAGAAGARDVGGARRPAAAACVSCTAPARTTCASSTPASRGSI